MKKYDNKVCVGIDYIKWHSYASKQDISIDLEQNIHTLISGMSGSGKSTSLLYYIIKLYFAFCSESLFIFVDFKQDDQFKPLRSCKNYFAYKNCVNALDIVYEKMHLRQEGVDKSRTPIVLVFDEYVAFILSLEKKQKEEVMSKIGEILMLGRSLKVSLVLACQRPDASVFPQGSRVNFGVIIVLGSAIKSIYDMVLPKELTMDTNYKFDAGEGVILLQSRDLKFIKFPIVINNERLYEICQEALNGKCKIEAKPQS